MRPYEIAVIFDAELDESEIRAVTDRLAETIGARGGTVDGVDRWGRRNFAYELKHRSEGFYIFIEATSEPPAMAEVDRLLTLADEVLRHRVIRLPDKYAAKVRSAAAKSGASAASK